MKNLFTPLTLIFILYGSARAQSGFEKVYGRDLPDFFRSVIATSDGNIVAVGVTKILEIDGTVDQDAYVVKTNSTGDTLWTRRIGSTLNDQANAVIENSQGYLVSGWYTIGAAVKYFATQLDENGNQLWQNFYGSGTYQYCQDLIMDNNNRNILSGGISGLAGLDFYLVKTDAAGNQINEVSFGGSGFDFANAVIQTSDGGYAIVGFTDTGTPGFDIYVVKCDSNLGFLWAHNYGGALHDYGYDIAEDANNNLWILGSIQLVPDTIGMVLIKTDADGGNPQMFFPGSHNGDYGYQIQNLNGGGFLIGGVTGSLEKGSEMLLEKLDANGDTLWTRHFGSTQGEAGFSVATDADENILLAGQTEGFGVNQFDAYLVKLDSDGDIPCPSAVSFVSSIDSLCEDENVYFTNTTVSSQQFTWSENGNDFSNNVNTSYYFSSGGSYDVALSACTASSSQNITVHPKPATHFTYSQLEDTVNFSLDAGIDVQAINWNFGDGSPIDTADINPTHIYTNLGVLYWVIVSVTDSNGCDSTYIEQINVVLSIENVKTNTLRLFPNPAHEYAMLQTSSRNIFPLKSVMMSVEGSVIKEFILTNTQEQISVRDLIPGIYFLKLEDTSGFTSTMKLEVY